MLVRQEAHHLTAGCFVQHLTLTNFNPPTLKHPAVIRNDSKIPDSPIASIAH